MNDFDIYELEQTESLSLFQRVIGVITDPTRVYDSLKEKPTFLGVYILTSIMTIFPLIWNHMDGTTKTMLIDQFQAQGTPVTEELLNITTISTLIGGAIGILIMPFIVGLIFHIIVMIQSHTGYKRTLTITTHAAVIGLINTWLVFIIQKLTGTTMQFSPAMFLDANSVSPILYTGLALLNIFTFWGMFVNYTGFKTVHNMNNKEATITVVTPFILSALFSIGVILLTQ